MSRQRLCRKINQQNTQNHPCREGLEKFENSAVVDSTVLSGKNNEADQTLRIQPIIGSTTKLEFNVKHGIENNNSQLQLACYQWKNIAKVNPILVWITRITKPTAKTYITPKGQAYHLNQSLVGIAHRQAKQPLPCQDASISTLTPRPILLVCDGAGSSAVSDIGSQTLCTQLTRLLQSLEPIISVYLDEEKHDDPLTLVRIIIRHAIGILQDLSDFHRRSIKDFRSTLNMVIIGKLNTLWLKVGDGEILQQRMFNCENYVSNVQNLEVDYDFLGIAHKGEFANQTQFVDDTLTLKDVQWGIVTSEQTTAFALMSDGVAEKFVSNQRNQVANKLTQWLELLRHDKLKITELYQSFYSKDFTHLSTGDDKGIAMYSRTLD